MQHQPVMSSLLHKTVKQVILHAVQHLPASCQALRWTGRLTGSHSPPELFERAIALESKAEAGYFEYGRYLDSLMRDARQRQAAKAARARGASSATAAQPDRFNGRARSVVCTLSLPGLHSGAMCRVSER